MKPRILFFFMAISCAFIFNCSGVNTQIEFDKSGIQYSKSQSSTKMIKGDKVAYELWIDDSKWEIYDSKDAGFIDFRNMQGSQGTGLSYVLKHNSGESMAVIQEIGMPAGFGTLHKTLSESLSAGKGSIISEEIRTVNGSDVLYIKWMEDLGTSKIVWLSYYLSNRTGHLRLAGGTTEQLLAEYDNDAGRLLIWQSPTSLTETQGEHLMSDATANFLACLRVKPVSPETQSSTHYHSPDSQDH